MNWQNTIRKASTEEEIIQEIGMALGGKEGDEFDLNLDDFKYDIQINATRDSLEVKDNTKGKIKFWINDDMVKDDFTWEFEIEFAGNIHTDYENTNVTLKLDDHDKTTGHLTFVLE